jgi:hypothetical protein
MPWHETAMLSHLKAGRWIPKDDQSMLGQMTSRDAMISNTQSESTPCSAPVANVNVNGDHDAIHMVSLKYENRSHTPF